jgi:DNA-binding GntR family transcriptional regulator
MNASDRAYSIIRQRLMTGQYEPGAQLKEVDISLDLGISRTPVRAALSRLATEGLVNAYANRGVFAAQWDNRDVRETFGLRGLLEAHAAFLAATNVSDEQVLELEALNERMRELVHSDEDNKTEQIQNINNAFHRLIIQVSASPRLIAICNSLVDTPMIIGSFYLYDPAETMRSVSQHEEIIRALRKRDPTYASQAMVLHLKSTFELYMAKRYKRSEN